MKATITRSCGHTESVTLYGGHYDDQIARLKVGVCRSCYRAQQTASAIQSISDMPALVGTDQQVAWARELRAAAIQWLDGLIEQTRRQAPAQVAEGEAIRVAVVAQTSAAWWIDHRHLTAREQVTMLAQQAGVA